MTASQIQDRINALNVEISNKVSAAAKADIAGNDKLRDQFNEQAADRMTERRELREWLKRVM